MKNTVLWMASILHLIWGGLLIFSPVPETVTGLNLLFKVFPNRYLLASALIVSSIMAFLAMYKYRGTKSLLLLLPQQFLLIIPAVAVVQAVGIGHFADGTVRPRIFLIADKISVPLLALFHSISLFNFHRLDLEE